jgi:hypothetical protein
VARAIYCLVYSPEESRLVPVGLEILDAFAIAMCLVLIVSVELLLHKGSAFVASCRRSIEAHASRRRSSTLLTYRGRRPSEWPWFTGLVTFLLACRTIVATDSISISAGGSYLNRPVSFAQSSEIDFSQTPLLAPPTDDGRDQAIAGTNWNMIYYGSNWTKTSDASAPQSAPSIWSGHWAPGSYGGGVIGAGGGHGIGNVFTYAPNGATRIYMSMRLYFDFDASQWHPISNKFVNITGDNSQILVQLNEGGNWRHAEELAFAGNGFGVDNNRNSPTSIAGQVDNRAVPNRQWTQLEVLIDLPNHVFKVWQDGVLTTNATPTFASTTINTVGINAFRGGGGETLTTDLYYKYDHFFIAW